MKFSLLALVVCLLSACAVQHQPPPPAASAAPAAVVADSPAQQIDRAIELARKQQFAQADADFTRIIASDQFRTFPTRWLTTR